MTMKTFFRKICIFFILLGTMLALLIFRKSSFHSIPPNDNHFKKPETQRSRTSNDEIPRLTGESINRGLFIINNSWVQIDKDICIFSAYWETRIKPYAVRVIGIGLDIWKEPHNVTCALKYDTGNVRTKVHIKRIPENHGNKHASMIYYCHTDHMPSHVTLSVEGQLELKWLKVKEIEPIETRRRNVAICVAPLYGKFDDNNLHIAEFVSYYRLLNASQFTFYDYKADYSVISLLSELSKSGVSIGVLKWNLPDQVKDAWSLAQIASIVDCVYRHTKSHEYAFFVDVDEFLVPRSNVSLPELIERIDSKGKWCSYMFRQSFFCLELPDDSTSFNQTDVQLFTLKKVLRAKRIWPPYMRTKSIVRTSFVDVPGIHYLWSTIPSKNKIMGVDPAIALLHHYRKGIDSAECSDNVRDNSAVAYGSLIMNSEPIELWQKWNKSTGHLK